PSGGSWPKPPAGGTTNPGTEKLVAARTRAFDSVHRHFHHRFAVFRSPEADGHGAVARGIALQFNGPAAALTYGVRDESSSNQDRQRHAKRKEERSWITQQETENDANDHGQYQGKSDALEDRSPVVRAVFSLTREANRGQHRNVLAALDVEPGTEPQQGG